MLAEIKSRMLLPRPVVEEEDEDDPRAELVRRLHRVVESEPCWSAIAALADELAAHEYLEADQIEDVIGFWFRSGT